MSDSKTASPDPILEIPTSELKFQIREKEFNLLAYGSTQGGLLKIAGQYLTRFPLHVTTYGFYTPERGIVAAYESRNAKRRPTFVNWSTFSEDKDYPLGFRQILAATESFYSNRKTSILHELLPSFDFTSGTKYLDELQKIDNEHAIPIAEDRRCLYAQLTSHNIPHFRPKTVVAGELQGEGKNKGAGALIFFPKAQANT